MYPTFALKVSPSFATASWTVDATRHFGSGVENSRRLRAAAKAKDMGALFWVEVGEPNVLGESNGIRVSKPPSPHSALFVFSICGDPFIPLHLCSQQVVHEIISGWTRQILKETGT